MFDLGWTELLVIGVVALIVVGPKDLPKMFRSLGQFTAKARAMAREFQRAMDDAADSTGVKDVARDLRKATDPQSMGLDEFNKLKNWDPMRDDPTDKPDKGHRKGNMATDANAEDEAALDRISAEMENLRQERAAIKAGATHPTAAPAKATMTRPASGKATKTQDDALRAEASAAANPKTTSSKTTKPKTTKPRSAKAKPPKPEAPAPDASDTSNA